MITKELIDYINSQRALGKKDDEIKHGLIAGGGWSASDLNEAFVIKKKKNYIITLSVIAIVVLIVGIVTYLVFKYSKSPSITNNSVKTVGFDDSDMKLLLARTDITNNSAPVFNTVKASVLTKEEKDFVTKHLNNLSLSNLPSVSESQKIISAHQDLLDVFNENADKQYQCMIRLGDSCFLNAVTNSVHIAALQSLVYYQQNKLKQSQDIANEIVKLGKELTANPDELTLLVGWTIQRTGYSILNTIKPDSAITADEKRTLIDTLRQEHKKSLRYGYTDTVEGIDYITSPGNKPTRILNQDEEETIEIYRQGALTNLNAWNPVETKKYFYDSYKIAISNIDLACGDTPAPSRIDLNFNPDDQEVENYVGKTLYTTTFASLDAASKKRCEVESLIEKL